MEKNLNFIVNEKEKNLLERFKEKWGQERFFLNRIRN